MASRFNPSALKLMEDALADVFYSHRDFDSFLRRCGIDAAIMTAARLRAEERKGAYERAPKRFVAQEVLQLVEAKGDIGTPTLTAIFDGLVKGTFPDATAKGKESLALLKQQFEQDRQQKRDEEDARRQWQLKREQDALIRPETTAKRHQERARLQQRFLDLHQASNPQQRGRDFELLVVELLEIEGLRPRHGIDRVGEQIDISFAFGPHTYLVEARWKQDPSEPKELRDFHGKCQGVHVDVRGVFISVAGYTGCCAEALSKLAELRVVMLDGAHLMSVLSGVIAFNELLNKVVRKACDEGTPYVPSSSL